MLRFKEQNAGVVASLCVSACIFIERLVSGESIFSSVFTASFFFVFSCCGVALFVLPLQKYLKARRKESLLVLLFAGVVGGLLIVTVLHYLLALILGSREYFSFQAAGIGALCGGSVALIFCVLCGVTHILPAEQSRYK